MKQPFKIFYENNFQAVCGFISKFTHANIEELANDAFLIVYNADEKLKEDSDRKNYLFAIAKNTSLNFIRPNKREIKIALDEPTDVVDDSGYFDLIEREIMNAMIVQYLIQHINNLPPKKRKILRLKYMLNKTEREIAEIMGMNIKTVYNHLGVAYNAIRRASAK